MKMENDLYERARVKYKPKNVKILFVGESRPNSGKFFYLDDTNLYNYTKKAFEQLGDIKNFSREKFRDLGCYLYDVCDVPVNKEFTKAQRRELLIAGLPRLDKTINELEPDYIIVVKKSDMKKVVYEHICQKNYTDNKTAFNLPFPNCGQQNEYVYQLFKILERIL